MSIEKQYELEGNLMIVFGKIILFLCILVIKRKFGRKSTEVLGEIEWLKFLFCPIFTIVTIAAMIVTFPYVANQMQANVVAPLSA